MLSVRRGRLQFRLSLNSVNASLSSRPKIAEIGDASVPHRFRNETRPGSGLSVKRGNASRLRTPVGSRSSEIRTRLDAVRNKTIKMTRDGANAKTVRLFAGPTAVAGPVALTTTIGETAANAGPMNSGA